MRFKAAKSLKEGLYYAIMPANQSPLELEKDKQSVEYNKIQTVALKFHQVGQPGHSISTRWLDILPSLF